MAYLSSCESEVLLAVTSAVSWLSDMMNGYRHTLESNEAEATALQLVSDESAKGAARRNEIVQ